MNKLVKELEALDLKNKEDEYKWPRSALNAWQAFLKMERIRMKDDGETVPKLATFMKLCSEKWKNLSEKEKKPFKALAEKEVKRYNAEMKNFDNKTPPPKPVAQKKKNARAENDSRKPKETLASTSEDDAPLQKNTASAANNKPQKTKTAKESQPVTSKRKYVKKITKQEEKPNEVESNKGAEEMFSSESNESQSAGGSQSSGSEQDALKAGSEGGSESIDQESEEVEGDVTESDENEYESEEYDE